MAGDPWVRLGYPPESHDRRGKRDITPGPGRFGRGITPQHDYYFTPIGLFIVRVIHFP